MKKFVLLGCLLLGASATSGAQTPGRYYTISSQSKCLSPENSDIANGSDIVAWTTTDTPAEKWLLADNGNGTVSLRCGYKDKYICTPTSAKDGSTLTSSTVKRNAAWKLQAVPGKNNVYNILSSNGSFVVMLEDLADGSHPTLRPVGNVSVPTEWSFDEVTDIIPERFDARIRDRMMTGFINQYYRPGYNGYLLGSGGFWSDAEMIEVILDAFETTGNAKYQNYYQQLVSNFLARQGRDWSYNAFNDDIAWMVLACVRGYKYFGDPDYLDLARENFERMYARAIQPAGTLRWSQNASDHGSNSCINGPAIIALCYLYEMTGEDLYLDRAKKLWKAQYDTLCDKNDGHIWDSGSWSDDWTTFNVGNYWGSTYNQGTMIGASIKLYRLTGDTSYKSYADKVYKWAYNSLTANNSLRVINACQTATGDLSGFKGILVRYVRLYAEEIGDESPLQWLEDNAFHAFQNSNSKGVVWSKWMSKTPENFKSIEGEEVKDFSTDAFGASTAVSVAFNAHVNRTFAKNAYDEITADMMDDIKWWRLSSRNTTTTDKATCGSWLCFKNVDFSSGGASAISVSASGDDETSIAIYLDNIADDCLVAKIEDLDSSMRQHTVEFDRTITGSHTVYVVNVGEGRGVFRDMVFSSASSIQEVMADCHEDYAIYDLYGRSYMNIPGKGIFIVNGIKTIIR